ncbi:MAG: hypothetical protein FWC47_01765 [Oscillospiraceae bacterium]|nr:hypothetical protein [Oscillospiraceae bacterium]
MKKPFENIIIALAIFFGATLACVFSTYAASNNITSGNANTFNGGRNFNNGFGQNGQGNRGQLNVNLPNFVSQGIINQQTADEITNYIQNNGPLTQQSFPDLVAQGILTQDQADKILASLLNN